MSDMKALTRVGEQLAGASNEAEIWSLTLSSAVSLLDAEVGAWVSAETGEILTSLPADHGPDGRIPRWAIDRLTQLTEPEPLNFSSRDGQWGEILALPVPGHAQPGWLVLGRTEAAFDGESKALGLTLCEIGRVAAAGMARYQRANAIRSRQVDELRTVQKMARMVGETMELQVVLQKVLDAVYDLIPYDAGEITLYDSDRDLLVRRAYRSTETADRAGESFEATYGLDEGLSGWLARNRSPLLINDVSELERIQPKSVSLQDWAHSYLGVPLEVRDQLVGTLEIASDRQGRFRGRDRDLAQLFGDQVAVAVENAQRYTEADVELRRRFDAMESLQRVTREIASTVSLDHILDLILDEALQFGDGDAGCVVTLSDEGDVVRMARGYEGERAVQLQAFIESWTSDDDLMARLSEREIVHLSLEDDRERFPLGLFGSGNLTISPIFFEQRLAGAIMVQTSQDGNLTPALRSLLEGLAVHVAIALGNAQRYQEQLRRGDQMRQRIEQMSRLLEMGRIMRSDRPLDDILLDASYVIQEGSGFEVVLISVLTGDALQRIAGAGIPLPQFEKHKDVRTPWNRVEKLCQDRFQIGRCYYIPAEHKEVRQGLDVLEAGESVVRTGENAWHPEDLFFVPLRGSTGNVLGVMSVDRPRSGRAPDAATAEVIEIFASQVALAIENSRLVEDLRRQVNTLSLFNELNRSITTKLDLQLVLNTVVQSVTNLLEYDYSTIFLNEGDSDRFVPLASSGYALNLIEDLDLSRDSAAIRRVARTGMPVVIEDAKTEGSFVEGRVPIGSSILVPLVVEGRPVGILTADRRTEGDFTPAEVATLTALADQVSVAVDNARLFGEVKRFSEELEARVAARTEELAEALEDLRLQRDRSEVLYRIASELVASLDMDRVLSQALRLLQRAVRADRGSVILLNNDTGELTYRAVIGHEEAIAPGGEPAPFSRQDNLVGWVLEHREAIILPDARSDRRYGSGVPEDMHAVMVVPIVGSASEGIGVILLQSGEIGIFNETHLQLVEAAAIQLGNALNNAELYRMIREQAERLGDMLRDQRIDAAKNEAILEGIADGVMVADADGQVILFNAAAERILSIDRSQALGRHQNEILGLYGNEIREWLSQIETWKQDPLVEDSDAFLSQRLEVGRRYVGVHISPVASQGNEFLGIVSVFRDITSEIEADRAKSEFVSTVSHELRTPMTSIVGYVDLLLKGRIGEMTEMQLSFLKKVKNNADRLTILVNDLLDISRIEQGRVELQREPVAVMDVVQQVVELMRPKIEEKGQSIEIFLPPDLPRIYADPARLNQIVTNLVSNAYKYTPTDGVIGVYAYVRDAMMHVAVSDTGIGIAPENQQMIFDRFYRVEDDPAVYEVAGTGLGLAITLSLIQMHGGEIWLESVLGEGSIFTFSMPLVDDAPTQNVGSLPPSLVEDAAPVVLVVEDDTEVRELLRVTLASEEYDVILARSGEEAVRMARENLPDFISLDIRLPDLDGFEVMQLLKREPETADIPVAIVSVVSDRSHGLELGAVAYLNKPLDAEKLLDVIERSLDTSHGVVVVDRDKDALDRMRAVLQSKGIGVRTTAHPERVLPLVQKFRPAMLVYDLTLSSEGNSYQLLKSLKRSASTSDIPVLVTGANRANIDTDELRALDVVRVVPKPYEADQLADDIEALIHERDALKEL
jgi:PAS domain S-box-containing protein